MKDLEIDEELISLMGKAIEEIIKTLVVNKENVTNKKEDIFKRYISFMNLYGFMNMYDTFEQLNKITFKLGYDLNNNLFHTKKFKEYGWGVAKKDIENNPFFFNENDEQDHGLH